MCLKKRERGKERLYFPIFSPVPVTNAPPSRTAVPRSAITEDRWGFVLSLALAAEILQAEFSFCLFLSEYLHQSSTMKVGILLDRAW